MVEYLVIIEGGGSTRDQQVRLREGFRALFSKLASVQRKPKPRCAGGRDQAFNDFKKTVKANPSATCLLLVDSEGPVRQGLSPWDHVTERIGDEWQRPTNATDDQLHFMVEAMEAWLVADPEALGCYYGSKFKKAKLPSRKNLEQVPKADLVKALEAATKDAKTKGGYQKSHGFDLIGKIDPAKVRSACPEFAERFFRVLEEH